MGNPNYPNLVRAFMRQGTHDGFARLVMAIVGTMFLASVVSAQTAVTMDAAGEESFIKLEGNAVWFRDRIQTMVKNSRDEIDDGTVVFYGDAEKHYNLIYVRGFSYVYQFAGDLISAGDAKSFLAFQLSGQRADGCIPDRVNSEGNAIYSPGAQNNQLADHALDNASFMALSVCRYVQNTGDLDFFRKHEAALRRGMDFIKRGSNGLVFNSPDNPQCVYGFTDVVKKTGSLLFSSVLYYDACLQLEVACRRAAVGEPDEYARRATLIKRHIGQLWDKGSGAFYAATGLCRQYDVWGTALVLSHPGLATEQQEERALGFLIDNYERYGEKGQIRHLLTPEVWQATFEYRAAGVYQNGGYWATPLAWFVPVIARRDPKLAQKILSDCLEDFRKRGINEWINGGVTVLPDYFVSAASVYSLLTDDRKAPWRGRNLSINNRSDLSWEIRNN